MAGTLPEIIISADSHVSEESKLWAERLPAKFRDVDLKLPDRRANVGDGRFAEKAGGYDPNERLKEMAIDGVSAEVLYPTLGLRLFGLHEADLQEACFRVYNDWISEYCSVAPDRLVGIGCVSAYNIENAVAEIERCKKNDLRGALVWQAPHPDLPLYSQHYDPLWAAAQDLDMPINFHILTGHNYAMNREGRSREEGIRGSVNIKTYEAITALYDLIFYGVLDRYPRMKIVFVENEVGWIPFFLQQWDYYYRRNRETPRSNVAPLTIDSLPSEYFARQVYSTFFDDAAGGHNFDWWGVDNCMWSNDYPHPNSTWPHSREVIARDLGHLSAEDQAKLVRDNVAKLYGLKVGSPLAGVS